MISDAELAALRKELDPLIGLAFEVLSLPEAALPEFEPSQIGTIVGTLMDALLPHLPDIPQVGLSKHPGILGDREGYPDYAHRSGKRLELKLLYVDNPEIKMKKPPTPREPSARLTQKVTLKNVVAETDVLLLIAYRLERNAKTPGSCSPAIIDIGLFPMYEMIAARDKRLTDAGGRWFGDYETPAILSRIARMKLKVSEPLDVSAYGRKSSEGRDYNEDTNFGKLNRIPDPRLQGFLTKHGATVVEVIATGDTPMAIVKTDRETIVELDDDGNIIES